MKPIKPMLAFSGEPFSAQGWIFEPKIDGTRCIAHVSNDVQLQNRRLRWITGRYPELVEALKEALEIPGPFILDGEIAVFSGGRPDFAALERREHQIQPLRIDYLSRTRPASYVIFDVLYVHGRAVLDLPLAQRKDILNELVEESELVVVTDYVSVDGKAYFRAAVKLGMEGVVAKRLDSLYQPGVRSPDWMKIKKRLTADLVVGGYIPGKGHRKPYFGSLLAGAYDTEGRLIYTGRVGTGFSEKGLEEICQRLEPIKESPFLSPPETPGVRWVRPEMVLEVSALEVTADGHLRAPVFLRLRDKGPEECTLEQLQAGGAAKQKISS